MSRFVLAAEEYLSAPGAVALFFHNHYPEGKQGGFELVHHGERVVTNGDLRLERAPGQWAAFPKCERHVADAAQSELVARGNFAEPALSYRCRLRPEGESLRLTVDLDAPLDSKFSQAAFCLELFPPAYVGRSYDIGDAFGVFAAQPVQSSALGRGKLLRLAHEDAERRLTIESFGAELELLDGRVGHANGWLVVRAPVTRAASERVVDLRITPHVVPGWQPRPVLCFSQVGYHPLQAKQLVVERDADGAPEGEVVLHRVRGELEAVLRAPLAPWGKYLAKSYGVFDFSEIREPGLYQLEFAGVHSEPFRIASDVYQHGVWQPTLECFFPVQMCHMRVCEGYRVWHGACHLDDAVQAPSPLEHFDGYRQGESSDTKFAPYEHIPGLDRGGWHDAGDYDLAAGSQTETTLWLALARECFGVSSDQTSIDWDARLVTLRRPDGVPDIVQQVAHGVENLLGGYRAAGHSFLGIIERDIGQYVHLGDAATMTDNLVGTDGARADDRLAFTTRDTALEYAVSAALSAASRVLAEHFPALAAEALATAQRTWERESTIEPLQHRSTYVPGRWQVERFKAAVELWLTTRDRRYLEAALAARELVGAHPDALAWSAARLLPDCNDSGFRDVARAAASTYGRSLAEKRGQNPFRAPIDRGLWGVGWGIQAHAARSYFLQCAFPDLVDREAVLAAVAFVLGCNPGQGTSLVSGVGARSLTVAYGTNRAEGSYIPGGVASGPALISPDRMELKTNFPFLWQQAEYVMGGAATYLFCVLAADQLLGG